MPSLVNGDDLLFSRRDDAALFLEAGNDAVDGIEKVLFLHAGAFSTGGEQSRFVTDIGDVGAGKAGCLRRQEMRVDGGRKRQRFQIDVKDLLAFDEIRKFKID